MTARRPIDRRAPLTDVGGRGEPEVLRSTQRRATGTGEPTPNTLSVYNTSSGSSENYGPSTVREKPLQIDNYIQTEVTERRMLRCQVTTLGKLFTHACLCHQAA